MIHPDAPAGAVLAAMLAFAEEAGRLALALRAAGLDVAHKGSDLGQALTQADLAISGLLHARFGPGLIEEETADGIGPARARDMLARDAWTFVATRSTAPNPMPAACPAGARCWRPAASAGRASA